MTRRVVGADGCAAGWVTVWLVDGAVEEVAVVEHLDEAILGGPQAVGVDMPVGLLDGRRDADVAARALLPGRASTVFSTPPRAVIDGYRDGSLPDHAAASAAAVEATGSGVTLQAWRLVPKIVAVDDLVVAGHPLLEVHPEVAFAVLVGEALPRKRSWSGVTTRRAVLARYGIDLPERFTGDEEAAPDDVLDAAVCAFVADGAAGAGPTLRVPAATTQFAHGRKVVITARPAPPVTPGPRRR